MEVHSGSGFDQAVGADTKPPSGKLSLFVARCSSCSVAGVVVSCKIPILATRVRFPGGALHIQWEADPDLNSHENIVLCIYYVFF